MEELVDLLKNLFSKDTRFHSKNEIKKLLKLKGEVQDKILEDALSTLVENCTLFYDEKQGYKAFPLNKGYAYGEIEINKAGTGFVHTKDGYTIMIENKDLRGALNGDIVIVSNITNKIRGYYHAEVYKVTKRKTGNLVFEVVGNGLKSTIIPYNSLECVNVNINQNEYKNLVDGDLILVKVGCEYNYDAYNATIEKVIGHKDDPNIDIKLILERYNIPVEFPEEVINEANLLPKEVTKEDLKNRVDLRNETIFTIDCDNTKDRDDSIGIKKLDNGNYLLKVNIAHVSYYIKEGSLIYQEALNRTASHYPCNTCIPMIPHVISNGICSLNPNVDRLTRTVEMEIDTNGVIVNYDIYNSVINSKIAMSYSKVNNLFNGEKVEEYNNFIKDLNLMRELNTILEKAREKRNYINFNTSEVEAIENKTSIEFRPNDLGLAGQIIENFMLIANNTVYKHYSWQILPYRVHEAPNEEKVNDVLNLLRISNIKIPKIKNVSSKSLKTIIDNLNNDEVSLIVREYLLKSMKKARYDRNNVGHFALQYDVYGHFTSPIRRIIDLITHISIDNIEKFDYSENSISDYEKFLDSICDKTNKLEKIDKQIEEEAMDMLMAEEMEKHIGEEFELYITDICKHSMMVRTANLIRGKIKLENIKDDKYYFDYDSNAIIGKSTKTKYQIGNKVFAIVKDASKQTRTINFEIPKQKIIKKIP